MSVFCEVFRVVKFTGWLGLCWLGLSQQAHADPLADAGCTGCHRIDVPELDVGIADWRQRKAPNLHYAGTKYRRQWLQSWLANPTRIRPAGLHPERHVVANAKGDEVDTASLPDHPSLSEGQITPVVDALMTLNWGQELLPEELKPVAVPKMLAQLNFIKFKGCGSCHRTTEKYGGMSGPELYTAWHRLQPKFLTSYIQDPQAWDPVAPMPGYSLPPTEVGKLVEYLKIIGKEHGNVE